MKYAFFTFFLLALSCSSHKKTPKNNVKETIENVETSKVKKEALIAVIKNPKQLENTKALIVNSGLTWEKLIFNQEDTKIALLKVPADKKDFWIKRLQQSGMFSSIESNNTVSINQTINKIKNTLVSFRKTPCYGYCPVFEIRINNNGKVFYNGIQNVLIKGKKEFQLSNKEFETLKEKLAKTSFSSYKTSYNNPRLMDAPSSYIKHNNKEIQLRVWKNVPTALVNLTKYIENLLLTRKYYE